jgi:biotin-dependent carboxylase-like uncharacterized protein
LDAAAWGLGNRLVGNGPRAAGLETTVLGCAVRFTRPAVVAVTGAACAVRVGGRPAAWGAPVRVPRGALLEVGAATYGVRSYLAVGGGIAVDPVLGSRSTDLLSGLGPPPLADGARLPLGDPEGPPAAVDAQPYPPLPGAGSGAALALPIVPGPRDDWFTPGALALLRTGTWTVSPQSNRIGLRTLGPALERARDGELPSEGMVSGGVQVPPDGRPVIFLADHPTTGGYPVIGVVPASSLSAAAQAPPGTPLRFVVLRAPRGG